MFREHASRAYTIAASESLWPAAKLGDAAMVDMLLRVGAKIKDAGVPEQTLIDTLMKGGLLEKVSPEGKHYQRECDWPNYELTGRPMTYMTSMCKRVVSTLPKGVRMYLPVLRYQALYYQTGPPIEHCGTFYYIDPSSSVLLDLGRTAVFGSKVHALAVLAAALVKSMSTSMEKWTIVMNKKKSAPELYVNLFDSGEDYMYDASMSDKWDVIYRAMYPDHGEGTQKLFVDNVMKSYYFSIVKNDKEVPVIPGLGTTSLYPTDKSTYWSDAEIGANDDIDQEICTYATLLGLDTIILQHEVGEYRAVSEILDTRADSYCHLFRVKEARSWYAPSKKYPTIWFTDDGFVTDKGATHDFKIDAEKMNTVVMQE